MSPIRRLVRFFAATADCMRITFRIFTWVLEFDSKRDEYTRLVVTVLRDSNGRLDAGGAFMSPASAGRCPECWARLDRPHELSCTHTTVAEFLAELGLSGSDLYAHFETAPKEH